MKMKYLVCALLAGGLLCGGCGGSGGGGGGGGDADTTPVQVNWTANREAAVNSAGGGYRIYYSPTPGVTPAGATMVEVPFVSGDQAPNSATLDLEAGTYYVRIAAYSALNTDGSELSDEITIVVP